MKKSMILVLTLLAVPAIHGWPFSSSSSSSKPQSQPSKPQDDITVVNKTSSYIVTVSGTRNDRDITKPVADVTINPSTTSQLVPLQALILPVGQQMTITVKNKFTGGSSFQTIKRENADQIVYEVQVSLGKLKVTPLNRAQAILSGYSGLSNYKSKN